MDTPKKVKQSSFEDSFAHDGQDTSIVQLTTFEKGLITDVASGYGSLTNAKAREIIETLSSLMHLVKTNSLRSGGKRKKIITALALRLGVENNQARILVNKAVKFFKTSIIEQEQTRPETPTLNTEDPTPVRGLKDIGAASKKAREEESVPSIDSVNLSPAYVTEFEKVVIKDNAALKNSLQAQQVFHRLVQESVIALSNKPREQQSRYMTNILSQHTDTLSTTDLSERQAAGVAAYVSYMTFFAQTDIARQVRQREMTPPDAAGSPLNQSLMANYNREEGGGSDYETKLNAIGHMSEAKGTTLLLLYRKLTGEDTQSLTKKQQGAMLKKINGWIHLRSPLLKSAVYLTRSLVPTLLTAGVGLAASTAAIGVLPHAALAILMYIVADIGVGALTHKTLNELKLVSGARNALNHLDDKQGYLPSELKTWLQAIFKYMHSDLGREAPRRHQESMTRGQLRDLIESGENAELRKQKYIHIFSRLAFGAGITGLHWSQFGDKWTDMFTAWLASFDTASSVSSSPAINQVPASSIQDGWLTNIFSGPTIENPITNTCDPCNNITGRQFDTYRNLVAEVPQADFRGGVGSILTRINPRW